jgi:hypothetical protein
VTLERALQRAKRLDSKTHDEIAQLRLGRPYEVFSEIRAYLLRRSSEMITRNNPIQLLKLREAGGAALIVLGPTIDKGPTPDHFHFDSGARLSFGLTLREVHRQSQLVSFRYHYQLPAARAPQYLRFDLNDAPLEDPLAEPRCHLHPGLENVRIPLSLHHPMEILDQIFFVLEKGV